MKLKDIQDLIEVDSKLELVNLTNHSLSIPSISSKYQNILIECSKELKILESEQSILKKDLIEYYKMNAEDSVYVKKPLDRKPLASQVDLFIEADPDWQKLNGKYAMAKMKVRLVEDFIKQLNNRSFIIKNVIEWEKFNNGGF